MSRALQEHGWVSEVGGRRQSLELLPRQGGGCGGEVAVNAGHVGGYVLIVVVMC